MQNHNLAFWTTNATATKCIECGYKVMIRGQQLTSVTIHTMLGGVEVIHSWTDQAFNQEHCMLLTDWLTDYVVLVGVRDSSRRPARSSVTIRQGILWFSQTLFGDDRLITVINFIKAWINVTVTWFSVWLLFLAQCASLGHANLSQLCAYIFVVT